MYYYPVFLDLRACRVVVIGGGRVAERKITTLLAVGACVTVISPAFTGKLLRWAASKKIIAIERCYRRGDLAKGNLVLTATNNSKVNQSVAEEARRRRIFVNIADQSMEGGFIVPASFRRRHFTVAVSTGGKNPSEAKEVRDRIKGWMKKKETGPKGRGI